MSASWFSDSMYPILMLPSSCGTLMVAYVDMFRSLALFWIASELDGPLVVEKDGDGAS